MGAVTSRPVVHTVESGLLAIARIVDVVQRAFDRLVAALVAKIFSRALYAHFYVTPPDAGEAAVDVGPDGLTRVCTNDGVCYIPATRVRQHRVWRHKQPQEDRLKRRKMRAEWAAAGLDVAEMHRLQKEKRKSKAGSINTMSPKMSRTTTRESDTNVEPADKEAASTKKEKPLYVMGNIAPQSTKKAKSSEKNQDDAAMAAVALAELISQPVQPKPRVHTQRMPKHSYRTLTAVREASHDHGATPPFDLPTPTYVSDRVPSDKKKRRESAPSAIMAKLKLKTAPVTEAATASRIVPNAQAPAEQPSANSADAVRRTHRPTFSLPANIQQTALSYMPAASSAASSSSPVTPIAEAAPAAVPIAPTGPTLVQPKPRRPLQTSFDTSGMTMNFPNTSVPGFVTDLTPGGVRVSPTPPPVAFRTTPRTRTSIDISPATTPFSGAALFDDASSIRSRKSTHTPLGFARSTTPITPPPSTPTVVQLADRACKTRWEASAKERKCWKGEVKRMALNKVHEQHSAYRASMLQQQLQQQQLEQEPSFPPLHRPHSTPATRN